VTDLRRLKHKIARLAASGNEIDAAGRDLGPASGRDGLLAILQEIDETILPSKLTFRIEDIVDVELEVANRRLLSFNGAIVPTDDKGRDLLIAALEQAVEGLFAGTGSPKVTASPINRKIGPDEIGCSSTMLAKVWGIDLYGDASGNTAERLDAFMDACSGISLAWLRRDAHDSIQKRGSDQDTTRLATLLEYDFPALERSFEGGSPDTRGAHCAILGSARNGTNAIAYIKTDTSLALVLIAPEGVPKFHALWQNTYQ